MLYAITASSSADKIYSSIKAYVFANKDSDIISNSLSQFIVIWIKLAKVMRGS